jgi:hypothetical protein
MDAVTALKAETTCPIPKTHNRLRQAHELWHEALAAYPEPAHFLLRLNSLIGALRSVTWVMQKELKNEDGFDRWYAKRQERLRADPILKWLVWARNEVEHRGDLEHHSTARVKVQVGAAQSSHIEFDVPAFTSPAEIAERTEVHGLPEHLRSDATLVVERRWIVEALPDREVMEALAHCYSAIAAVVMEAHEWGGFRMRTFGGEAHGDRHQRLVHPSGRLPCMLAGLDMRTARWDLRSGGFLDVDVRDMEFSADDVPALMERYKDLIVTSPTSADPIDVAAAFHEWGKQMLARDGGHRTVAWLFASDTIAQVGLNPRDQQGKDVMMARLAQEAERLGASAAVFSTETWFASPLPPGHPYFGVRAGKRPDRQEGFVTYAAIRDGRTAEFFTPFTRPEGKIRVGTTQRQDGVPLPAMAPLMEMWTSWPAEPREQEVDTDRTPIAR